MAVQNKKDYLCLIWQHPISRRKYVIGFLTKNQNFEFSYGGEVQEAINKGFQLLISFPEIDKVYKNNEVFSVFTSRLPDQKRKDIAVILQKYGLTEYNAYDFLGKSGAKLPIDNLEFIEPISNFESGIIEKEFYLAGPRYYLGCTGESCEKSLNVELQEQLNLVPEPENIADKHAIKITNSKGDLLGYLPRYYSECVSEIIKENRGIIECNVHEVNKENKCNECIKVKLIITKK